VLTFKGILASALLPELLSESDENSFGTADVAEPVNVLVVDDFIDHRRPEFDQAGKSVVEILDGEHDAKVPQRIHGSHPVI
jgi:hypothetical protein